MVLRDRSVCNEQLVNVVIPEMFYQSPFWLSHFVGTVERIEKKKDSSGVEDAEDFHGAKETMAQKKTALFSDPLPRLTLPDSSAKGDKARLCLGKDEFEG